MIKLAGWPWAFWSVSIECVMPHQKSIYETAGFAKNKTIDAHE